MPNNGPTIGSTVLLTRRVSFSSGHRYWLESLSEDENRRLFGPWASPFNHGHNYILDVSFGGPVDAETGMVVNIKDIDDLLRRQVVSLFDGKSINDEVPGFTDRAPTLENLMLYIRSLVEQPSYFPAVEFRALRLEETPLIYGEFLCYEGHSIMTLTRVYEFAASHRLHVPSLSDAENEDLFGKCNNPAGHGHNYVLEVSVEGTPSADTGMLADINEMDRVVNELVVDRYDHKNFNVDLPEFEGRVTTSEAIVGQIFSSLNGKLPAKLHRVRLHETARNIFEVCAN